MISAQAAGARSVLRLVLHLLCLLILLIVCVPLGSDLDAAIGGHAPLYT